MKLHHSEMITQTPEIVFPWIADPEKAMKWQKNVKGGEVIIDQPEKIGTTFREIIEEDGKTLDMKGEITRYVKNKEIGFHLWSRIHEFNIFYTLETVAEETKFSIDVSIQWKFPMNIVCLVVGKKIEGRLTKQLMAEVADLKKMCED